MLLPKYPLRSDRDLTVFEFTSEGPRGAVRKMVLFSETNLHGFFNLAFGDRDADSGGINDLTVTNNDDAEKVLTTVVAAVYAFTDRNREAWVYATGSTKARTRLYRMGISRFIAEVSTDFEILGERNDEWEAFRKNVEYEGFLVRRKR